MDDTLSIYIIIIKGSSFYTLVQIFPEYTWVCGFGSVKGV